MLTNTGVIALYRFCYCFRSPFPCFFFVFLSAAFASGQTKYFVFSSYSFSAKFSTVK